jgi:hypothetical protein
VAPFPTGIPFGESPFGDTFAADSSQRPEERSLYRSTKFHDPPIQFPHGLFRQLVEQRLGVLKVGGVEALGEPAVDLGQRRARLITPALLIQ